MASKVVKGKLTADEKEEQRRLEARRKQKTLEEMGVTRRTSPPNRVIVHMDPKVDAPSRDIRQWAKPLQQVGTQIGTWPDYLSRRRPRRMVTGARGGRPHSFMSTPR